MKRFLTIYIVGFLFIFLMSVILTKVQLAANPYLTAVPINPDSLSFYSNPTLLYYYLPDKFWAQTFSLSAFGSLLVALLYGLKAKKS